MFPGLSTRDRARLDRLGRTVEDLAVQPDDSPWILPTAYDAATGYYAWKEQDANLDGTFKDRPDGRFGIVAGLVNPSTGGVSAVTWSPAREISGAVLTDFTKPVQAWRLVDATVAGAEVGPVYVFASPQTETPAFQTGTLDAIHLAANSSGALTGPPDHAAGKYVFTATVWMLWDGYGGTLPLPMYAQFGFGADPASGPAAIYPTSAAIQISPQLINAGGAMQYGLNWGGTGTWFVDAPGVWRPYVVASVVALGAGVGGILPLGTSQWASARIG